MATKRHPLDSSDQVQLITRRTVGSRIARHLRQTGMTLLGVSWRQVVGVGGLRKLDCVAAADGGLVGV